MTSPKEPVLLVVWIETAAARWYVAGIRLAGEVLPLLRSEEGDFAEYREMAGDEQVSFLRHRFSGVLQRGCDRLWGREAKACHIIFVADAELSASQPELTERLAEHFVIWMTKPPVVFFTQPPGEELGDLQRVAGELPAEYGHLLQQSLSILAAARGDVGAWELAPKKRPTQV